MAGSRTLKLSILADVDDLKKKLNQGENDVQGFGGKLDDWSKKAGLAFAAAGAAAVAYAGKLAVDGVKAAIEDEAAQLRLANALKNVTGATDSQIKSAEDWILKSSLATGVADDQLRPALERLTRSTKDIKEAQDLTNLALDIAKAKNLDLETVANALAKANDGQTGALKKLGITLGDNATNLQEYNKLQKALEKAQLEVNFTLEQYGVNSKEYTKAVEKVKDITGKANDIAAQGIDIFGELGKEFSGAAAEAANTFEGKMARLKIAFDETKETVGSFILDAVTPMLEFIVNKVIPNFGEFTNALEKFLVPAIKFATDSFNDFFLPAAKMVIEFVDGIIDKLKQNTEIFQVLGGVIGAFVLIVKNVLAPAFLTILKPALVIIGELVEGLITAFGLVAKTIVGIVEAFQKLINLVKNNPITRFFGANDISGGASFSNASYSVPTVSAVEMARESGAYQGGTVINVTGAIDPESVARQINDILTQSAARGGGATNLIYA